MQVGAELAGLDPDTQLEGERLYLLPESNIGGMYLAGAFKKIDQAIIRVIFSAGFVEVVIPLPVVGDADLAAITCLQLTGFADRRCIIQLNIVVFLKDNTVDLIFLDINMPLLTGMELAALLSGETAIVFTTAHFEHAAESYSFNTIDYLLKPITLKRFLAATKKIEAYFQARMPVTDKPAETGNEYFFVKSGTELRKILLPEVLFFESRKEYVRVVTQAFEVLTYRRLKDIEAQLNVPFARVHNSYIVNIIQMDKIQDNHIHIGEMQIPIGEKFRDGQMEMIRKKTF